jgi:hypothetical protein
MRTGLPVGGPGEAVTLDHGEAEVTDDGGQWRLPVRNPTGFDAAATALAEPASGFATAWRECVREGRPVPRVPARGRAEIGVATA